MLAILFISWLTTSTVVAICLVEALLSANESHHCTLATELAFGGKSGGFFFSSTVFFVLDVVFYCEAESKVEGDVLRRCSLSQDILLTFLCNGFEAYFQVPKMLFFVCIRCFSCYDVTCYSFYCVREVVPTIIWHDSHSHYFIQQDKREAGRARQDTDICHCINQSTHCVPSLPVA